MQDMRDQMKEMEVELLQYHKSNAALDLMIGEQLLVSMCPTPSRG